VGGKGGTRGVHTPGGLNITDLKQNNEKSRYGQFPTSSGSKITAKMSRFEYFILCFSVLFSPKFLHVWVLFLSKKNKTLSFIFSLSSLQ
jgi:hypothetical protein